MQKPTSRWRAALGKDPHFTEQNIQETDTILDHYVQSLKNLTGGDQNKFEHAIRDVVMALNELGGEKGRYPELIESLERDELADFIIENAKAAGYVPAEQDVTFKWRDW